MAEFYQINISFNLNKSPSKLNLNSQYSILTSQVRYNLINKIMHAEDFFSLFPKRRGYLHLSHNFIIQEREKRAKITQTRKN